MKQIVLALAMLIALATVALGQRETAREAGTEFATAKWVEVMKDDNGYPISMNISNILRINGIAGWRTKYVKRGTTIYQYHFGNCTTDMIIDAEVGWASYLKNPKLVSVKITNSGKSYKAEPESVASAMLTFACENPTEVKVVNK